MPKATLNQFAFNGGQLGPRVQGRADLARYRTGTNVCRNFLPTVQGPAVKRSGTRYVRPVKDSADEARLISFEFSRDQAYILEFGDQYMRVYRDGGPVLRSETQFGGPIFSSPTAANPVQVTTSAIHGLSTGDYVYITGSAMTELNERWFHVTYVSTTVVSLTNEDGTGRSTGPGGDVSVHYEIATPYDESQLFDIQVAQSQDVLYLAHPLHAPYKLERTSDTDWTATEIEFDKPAFRAENTSDITMSVNGATGSGITLTASAPFFTSAMVGSWVKISEVVPTVHQLWVANSDPANWETGFGNGSTAYYENSVYTLSGYAASDTTGNTPPTHDDGAVSSGLVTWTYVNDGSGYAEITAYGSSTSVTIDATNGVEFPASVDTSGSGAATTKWSIGAWSDEYGFPRSVAFYEDRLWWAGTVQDPQTFWGSRTFQYEDLELIGDEDDAGLQFTLSSDKLNAIEWMVGEDVLFIGSRGSEWTADSGSADEAITPSNIRVRRRSNYGSAESVQPLTVDSALLFLHRSGRRLHELVFDFNSDRYVAPDLTELSYDIALSGIIQLAYQPSPFRQVWAALGDGTLAALTYVKDQDVLGWSKHVIGGTDVVVESVAAVPHPDGDEDQVWLLVSRTINGGTVRYVEYLEKPYETDDAQEDAFFVDSGLTYSGASTTTVTGLDHLEGETVSILGDGTKLDDATVSGGAVTLSTASETAQIGLAMPEARLQTMRLEGGMEGIGSAQGRRKRVRQVVIRVDNTGQGLEYGADFDSTMDTWDQPTGTPIPLVTGDTESLDMPSGWEREGRVALSHGTPLPCTIVSIMPQLNTEPR